MHVKRKAAITAQQAKPDAGDMAKLIYEMTVIAEQSLPSMKQISVHHRQHHRKLTMVWPSWTTHWQKMAWITTMCQRHKLLLLKATHACEEKSCHCGTAGRAGCTSLAACSLDSHVLGQMPLRSCDIKDQRLRVWLTLLQRHPTIPSAECSLPGVLLAATGFMELWLLIEDTLSPSFSSHQLLRKYRSCTFFISFNLCYLL
jgi:hypothetical protein